jgi:hypothetical protein
MERDVKHQEAVQQYRMMAKAIWPDGRFHEEEHESAWYEFLERLDERVARQAISDLRYEVDKFPTFAAFKQRYDHRLMVDHATKPAPAIDTPYDVRDSAKVKAMVAFLHDRKPAPITAKMLDEAAVPHWRERLRDAQLTDEDERRPEKRTVHIDHLTQERTDYEILGGQHGPTWDEAWSNIRAEAGFAPLVLPDGATYGETR